METHRLARLSALLLHNPMLIARGVMQLDSEESGSTHHPIVSFDTDLRKWHD
jgi:hypothetical protein